ncbi:hypothetical protein K439DRAFT_533189 [Ramaria rubella]|nr:hypothetical protein K439DRAFT_533189 [Ramaria rubella]
MFFRLATCFFFSLIVLFLFIPHLHPHSCPNPRSLPTCLAFLAFARSLYAFHSYQIFPSFPPHAHPHHARTLPSPTHSPNHFTPHPHHFVHPTKMKSKSKLEITPLPIPIRTRIAKDKEIFLKRESKKNPEKRQRIEKCELEISAGSCFQV